MNTARTDEWVRARKLCNGARLAGFVKRDSFADWWVSQLDRQRQRCYYCDTAIELIRAVISVGLLETRKTGYGVRGPYLEIDRMDARKPYSPENCVLACYYCNNDKSYIYTAEDYRVHFGPARKRHFELLARNMSAAEA